MATSKDEPGWVARIGMALVSPRWALAVADDPRHPGRAGSDLLRLFLVVLIAVHTRNLIAAVWLTITFGLAHAGQSFLSLVSQAFTVPLAFLVAGAALVWIGGGPRRSVGRAFDLACVALVPMLAVEIVVTLVLRGAGLPWPDAARAAVLGVGFAWSGGLLALALTQLRRRGRAVGEAA